MIAGQISSYNGSVKFYSTDKRIGFAYVPQIDQLVPYLTTEESLLFASKFKNPAGTNHREEVEFVVDSFNLHAVQSQFTTNCSGGEKKRLSIGLEMISKPKILLLDEPTTGLDSTTAFTVTEVLKKINRNTAIITTIHQPNTNLFQLFDRVYLLTDGKCIYSGPPTSLVDHLKIEFNVLCPKFTNPADFVLDIANNTETVHGSGLIRKMAKHEQEQWTKRDQADGLTVDKNHSALFWDAINEREVQLREINRSSLRRKHNFFREYYLNVAKMFLANLRDPKQVLLRAGNNAALPILLWIIMSYKVGSESGCTFLPSNSTHIKHELIFERLDRQITGVKDVAAAFVNLTATYFGAQLPSILNLAQMIRLLRKENLNAYYSPKSFFFAILTVNLILGIFYAAANTASYFIFTGEAGNPHKIFYFGLILFLTCVLGDNFGLFLCITYPENFITALVVGAPFSFLLFILTGFLIPIRMMPSSLQTISGYLFSRNLFEELVRILYAGYKCRLDEQMILNFDQINEFIRYFNFENKANLSELTFLRPKIKEALNQSVWNRTMVSFSESLYSLFFLNIFFQFTDQRSYQLNERSGRRTKKQIKRILGLENEFCFELVQFEYFEYDV